MIITSAPFKSKAWGIIRLPNVIDHFHTGYVGDWNGAQRNLFHTHGAPKANMEIGENVIIEGDFHIATWSRGRSAANFVGYFRDNEAIKYDLSMEGTATLFDLIQSGVFPIRDGYFAGRWTFVKQGESIFLKPFLP